MSHISTKLRRLKLHQGTFSTETSRIHSLFEITFIINIDLCYLVMSGTVLYEIVLLINSPVFVLNNIYDEHSNVFFK